MEATHNIREFMCGMVVIHLRHLTIPFNQMCMAVTCIEVRIGHLAAVFAIIAVDAISIISISNQG
jgi:hypothetical protein